MPAIDLEPVLTDTYAEAARFRPSPGLYVYGESQEARSGHIGSWRSHAHSLDFRRIGKYDASAIEVNGNPISLRSERQLTSVWLTGMSRGSTLYLDITGLPHHVWAPLLRAALFASALVTVVYVEPDQYTRSSTPVEGAIYDLSSKIEGVAPIPGFAFLSAPGNSESLFVPLLGFEGTRLAHVIEHVQPSNDRIIPLIGCPGFKPEFVYEAYYGNRRSLSDTKAWHQARLITANCPFSCYYALSAIADEHPKATLMIAPIGTKPHALGAILFYLAANRRVEIVYDHPTRKSGRTSGSDRLLAYHVSALTGLLQAREASTT